MLSRTLLSQARRPLLSPFAPQLRSMSSPTPPIGNPLDLRTYQAGRDSALKWAKENGYSDECMVEVQVAWGEQGESANLQTKEDGVRHTADLVADAGR